MSAAPYYISHEWEEPQDLVELLDTVRETRPEANLAKIRYAYFVAEKAHGGQLRRTGEPYISHPLAVAKTIAELRMDDEAICAALLHDVLEDCAEYDAEKLSGIFGEEVVEIVEGVTKLKFSAIQDATPTQRARAESHRAAETLRKMLLAMAKDIRVIILKLADRLHNMMTLDGLSPDKRIRIANETLDVYAPLAARLGIWQIKWQLEDLSFRQLHPKEFKEVSELVAKSRSQREDELRTAILLLKERLEQRGIRGAEVQGRPKHLYSIFSKMVKHGFDFADIHDLLAVRIVVPEVSDCYVALGVVHDLWMPIPGLFYDYIAKPKSNGYQSLHTKVVGPNGDSLEVQIRTQKMHEIAEYGVAAHWTYKEGKSSTADSVHLRQLREQLFDWSSDARMSSDFLRTISTDLFSEQVFVFTPKGDVIDLPKDSTPVDFGFRVHSQLGLQLVGARVNGTMVPLSRKLENGDVVELITRSNAQPSMDWLEFVKSANARSKLKNYFRKQMKTVDAQRGKDALEKELKSLGIDPKRLIGEDKFTAILDQFDGCENATDVFAKIGSGLLSAQSVASKLRGITPDERQPEAISTSKTREGQLTLTHDGIDTILVKRAKCCDPIPGDDVVGYVTRGRGIMIHRKICPNAMRYQSTEPERLMPLRWPSDGRVYSVVMQIVTMNRQGLLMDISTIFGESGVNVSAARIRTLPNQTAEIDITIEVRDTDHLSQVMNKIGNFADVISILRVFGRTAAK